MPAEFSPIEDIPLVGVAELNGFTNVLSPTAPTIDKGGDTFYSFDPLAILLASDQISQDIKDFYCSACANYFPAEYHSSTELNAPTFSEFQCVNDPNLPDTQASVCEAMYQWALGQLRARVGGFPPPTCQNQDGTSGSTFLELPHGLSLTHSECPNVTVPLSAQQVIDALKSGTCQQQEQLTDLIICCGDPESPIALSIDKSDPSCKGQLGGSTAVSIGTAIAQNLPAVAEALALLFTPQGELIICAEVLLGWIRSTLLPWILQNVSLQIICDPSKPPGLSFTLGAEGQKLVDLVYNLYPTIDCGGGTVQGEDVVVQYNACGQQGPPSEIVVPSVVGPTGSTQVGWMQLVLDKLSNLEACCPPCDKTELVVLEGIKDIGVAQFPSVGQQQFYDGLWFEITASAAQIAAEFSNPPRWKYGTFTFQYADGTFSNPQFVNYDRQRFFIPRQDTPCIGMSWHLAPGIVATVHGVIEPTWFGGVVYR